VDVWKHRLDGETLRVTYNPKSSLAFHNSLGELDPECPDTRLGSTQDISLSSQVLKVSLILAPPSNNFQKISKPLQAVSCTSRWMFISHEEQFADSKPVVCSRHDPVLEKHSDEFSSGLVCVASQSSRLPVTDLGHQLVLVILQFSIYLRLRRLGCIYGRDKSARPELAISVETDLSWGRGVFQIQELTAVWTKVFRIEVLPVVTHHELLVPSSDGIMITAMCLQGNRRTG